MSFWNKVQKVQDKTLPRCTVIVPAAGSSRRMGGGNKLMMDLCGIPVLQRTLMAIDSAALADEIIVAAREEDMLEIADLCHKAGLHKPIRVVQGGESRTASVLAAAMECRADTELIAVHDGARPLVRPQQIDDLIRLGAKTNAVAPALPVTDTIKVADDEGKVVSTPDRDTLYAVQTPQVFQANILRAALQSALNDGVTATDDCAAVERLGKEVYLTPGDPENIKITTPFDLIIGEAILTRGGDSL
ncbi:MAG: 2-C-methyl-D-erythritol 4-phosphate cytidylyltransferase [Oscillospiraceae bacterium]|nr:2-C-methyl-D-erythritol 4-phosphate cytidylyltransferase [Oscillospiraceae bacterium]